MRVTIDKTELKLDNVKEGSAVAIDVSGDAPAAAASSPVRPVICADLTNPRVCIPLLRMFRTLATGNAHGRISSWNYATAAV